MDNADKVIMNCCNNREALVINQFSPDRDKQAVHINSQNNRWFFVFQNRPKPQDFFYNVS